MYRGTAAGDGGKPERKLHLDTVSSARNIPDSHYCHYSNVKNTKKGSCVPSLGQSISPVGPSTLRLEFPAPHVQASLRASGIHYPLTPHQVKSAPGRRCLLRPRATRGPALPICPERTYAESAHKKGGCKVSFRLIRSDFRGFEEVFYYLCFLCFALSEALTSRDLVDPRETAVPRAS